MSNRVALQALLERLLGSRNVYYQPPEGFKLNYPAIVYSKSDITSRYANNKTYTMTDKYEITIITKSPVNNIVDMLLEQPTCRFNRHYVADNLNHDVLTLYY